MALARLAIESLKSIYAAVSSVLCRYEITYNACAARGIAVVEDARPVQPGILTGSSCGKVQDALAHFDIFSVIWISCHASAVGGLHGDNGK
jgi:hypothetical protein